MSDSFSSSTFFRHLSSAAREALAACARATAFERHERIAGPGAPVTVHLLVRGLAERRRLLPRTQSGTVWLLSPGELIGASAVLPRPFEDGEVVALENVDTLAFFPRDILALGRTHPEIFLGLAETYARRIAGMASRTLAATTDDVAARLARLLLDIVPPADGDRFVPLSHRLTHETMARAIGASRPYTTVIFAELERRGALRREGRSVYVRREALRSIALHGAES